MFTRIQIPVLSLALFAILAPASFADGFGISFAKKSKHGAVSLHYSSGPFWAPGSRAHCAPARWVPGHYETVCRKTFVPGCRETVWVEPEYVRRRDGCGRLFRVCVSSGRYEVVRQPGHYETRKVRVWVEGHFES